MKARVTEIAETNIVRFADPSWLYTSQIRACILNLTALLALGTPAAQAQGDSRPALMERQKEIALALSACPASVASKAAIYILELNGYVKIRDSQNGFTAIVQHSMPASQEPQCMDEEGTRTLLPRYMKVAEWRAKGKTPEEIKRLVADGFAKGDFQHPTRPGVDYMLSKENIVPNAKGEITRFPPHVMFYAPYLTNADVGAGKALGPDGNPEGPAFVAGEGSPNALIIVPLEERGDSRIASKRSSDPAVASDHRH